jgi:hypothetical protein
VHQPSIVPIENNNLAGVLPGWLPAVILEREGDFLVDRPTFDPTTGRATTERVVVRNGRVRRFSFSVRMFIPVELRDWLLEPGFTSFEFYSRTASPHRKGATDDRRRASVADEVHWQLSAL